MFLFHLLSTAFLCGLIWIVQLVHYPSFFFVPEERFAEFEKFHQWRISLVVGPAMLIELLTAVMLCLQTTLGENPAFRGSLFLLAVIWLSTLLLQGPDHGRLERGYDRKLIARLVRTNWIRTLSWSARAVLLVLTLIA